MQVRPTSPSASTATHSNPNHPPQPTFNPDSSEMTRDVILLNRYIAVEAAAGAGGFKVGDVVALQYAFSPLFPRPTNPLAARPRIQKASS